LIPVRALELPVSSGVITAKMPGAITPKGDRRRVDQCGGCEQYEAFGQKGSYPKSRRQAGRSDKDRTDEEGCG
jgi:hypothetical protein